MPSVVMIVLAIGGPGGIANVQGWMQQAFYPALLLVLIAASLGVPIPEDIPLIAAGVLHRTHPGIASWHGTLAVALFGVMTGDLVLYTLGRRWGPGVLNHRSVSWLVTPERYSLFARRFHRYGAWFCFFGRFLMGIRAAMCLTAGATHFPWWRFLIADLAGAMLSVPLFVFLGYWCAGMIPRLLTVMADAQAGLLAAAVLVVAVMLLFYQLRRRRRARRIAARRAGLRALRDEQMMAEKVPAVTAPEPVAPPSPHAKAGS